MNKLGMVEQLDGIFPGLADQVRMWFLQGVPVRQVPRLLMKQYNVSISATPIARFRTRRWVPEQEIVREKRLTAQAALQVSREETMRASLESGILPPAE
jgi:hypothetical protein